MRAFDKLKMLVGSGGGQSPEPSVLREIDDRIASAKPARVESTASQDASEDLRSDAEKIEEALLEFHDLDLLADSAG